MIEVESWETLLKLECNREEAAGSDVFVRTRQHVPTASNPYLLRLSRDLALNPMIVLVQELITITASPFHSAPVLQVVLFTGVAAELSSACPSPIANHRNRVT